MEIKNPAFNYDKHGQKYSGYRRTDPRIAEYVYSALGSATRVLNVGDGTMKLTLCNTSICLVVFISINT